MQSELHGNVVHRGVSYCCLFLCFFCRWMLPYPFCMPVKIASLSDERRLKTLSIPKIAEAILFPFCKLKLNMFSFFLFGH